MMQATFQEARSISNRNVAATPDSESRIGLPMYTVIFGVALVLRLWFNFIAPHINISNACDAWEYLSNAAAIHQLKNMPASFWGNCIAYLTGSASTSICESIRAQLLPLQGLSNSGPAFPVFLASCFLVTGLPFELANWVVPVSAQTLVSSLTCLIVADIASKAWSRKVGILSGLITAIYPGFLISTGRLTTETFAGFLLALSLWLMIRGLASNQQYNRERIILGATLGILQLTRPVLMLVSLLAVPVVITQSERRKRIPAILCLLAGIFCVLAPWAGWQAFMSGKLSPIVDRCGGHEWCVGTDQVSQGWVAVPLQTFNGEEKKSVPALAAATLMRDPAGFVKMSLYKVARLGKFPCNDFRANVGPFTPSAQSLFHQFLLALAACGLILSVFVNVSGAPPLKHQIWSRLLIVAAIAVHLAYIPFITVARYLLPALPLLFTLSAAGLVSILESAAAASTIFGTGGSRVAQPRFMRLLTIASALMLLILARVDLIPYLVQLLGPDSISICLVIACVIKTIVFLAFVGSMWCSLDLLSGNRNAARALIVIFSVIIFPSVCLQSRVHGRWWEWQCNLKQPGESVSETIYLPKNLARRIRSRQCYLMVDADGWQQTFRTATLRVNGKPLAGPIIPSLSLPDCIWWYVNQSGGGLIRHYEHIFSFLAMRAGLALPDLRQWFLIPLPAEALAGPALKVDICQVGASPTKLFGTYPVKKQLLQIPDVCNYSWEKAFYGVENDAGLCDPRIDDVISRKSCPERKEDLSTEPGLQCGNFNVRLLSPDVVPGLANQFLSPLSTSDDMHKTISVSAAEPFTFALHDVPQYGPAKLWWGPQNLWLVRVSGKAKGSNDAARPYVAIYIHSRDSAGKEHQYRSPWTPSLVNSSRDWVPFDLAIPVNPRALPGKVSSIEAECYANDPVLSTVSPPPSSTPRADFSDLKLEVLSMPYLPTGRGYSIY